MRTTIDAACRIVIPRGIREQVGLYGASEVEIEVDGAGVRVVPVADGELVEEAGRLVIPPTGGVLTADDVEQLRDADRR